MIKNNRFFLVDTENTSDFGFISKLELSNLDTIVLFNTCYSKNISINSLERIFKSGVNVEFENVTTGTKNELDFKMVVYLCMNLKSRPGDYYIVSEDNGFKPAIEYAMNLDDSSSIVRQIKPSKISSENYLSSLESSFCLDENPVKIDTASHEESNSELANTLDEDLIIDVQGMNYQFSNKVYQVLFQHIRNYKLRTRMRDSFMKSVSSKSSIRQLKQWLLNDIEEENKTKYYNEEDILKILSSLLSIPGISLV